MSEPTPNVRDISTVAQALADLALRLDISSDEISVESHVEIDWPDTSLGCPRPGMRYAQVITNGTLTVLTVDGCRYRYHAGGGRTPFRCDDTTP